MKSLEGLEARAPGGSPGKMPFAHQRSRKKLEREVVSLDDHTQECSPLLQSGRRKLINTHEAGDCTQR